MSYNDFRAWAKKKTEKGGMDFRFSLYLFYTVQVMDAVPRRKRERVWRQLQNIVHVPQEAEKRGGLQTRYALLRSLNRSEMANVIENGEDVCAMVCDRRYCSVKEDDWICEYVEKKECQAATVRWLNGTVEKDDPLLQIIAKEREPIEVE